MFIGRCSHSIDDKSRLTFPANFRKLLEEGGFITVGFDQNLIVLTTSAFEKAAESIRNRSITDPEARNLRRDFFGNAERFEFDKAGRILLPQFLRTFAGLDTTALFIGSDTYIELWSPERYSAFIANQNPEADTQRYREIDLVI
jgi:MraZ protein